ncbi:hypothetical protein BDW62DRAFT_188881 [Aspergillus aurantiobrunneus]
MTGRKKGERLLVGLGTRSCQMGATGSGARTGMALSRRLFPVQLLGFTDDRRIRVQNRETDGDTALKTPSSRIAKAREFKKSLTALVVRLRERLSQLSDVGSCPGCG